MRNELLETFEAALTMALDQKDETTADYYSILIKHLKRLKRAEHLQQLSFISKEKPKKFISKFAVTGFYFFDNKVISYAKKLKPSKRNELEIVDLLNN